MRKTLRSSLSLLPIAGILLLTACPQMMTSPVGAPGSPLSAGGEGKTVSDKTVDSEETTAPPTAAAPIPPPSTIGGGDSAATTPPPTEPAFRSLDGAIGGDTPVPVSGPVASSDRGILPAPTSREAVDTNFDNLRVVYWSSSERRTWTDAEDFFAKLAAGQITDDVADGAKVMHWSIVVAPLIERLPDDPPVLVRQEEDVLTNGLVHDPGYYLFFFTADGLLWDMGPETMDVTSAAQLKTLVAQDQVDPEGHPFRIRFLGERSIIGMPMIKVDPSLLHPPLPGTPSYLRHNPPPLVPVR
jgi:hypothetical protein